MSNNSVKRFFPQLAFAALALSAFAGWGSAATMASGDGSHALASPSLSTLVQSVQGNGVVSQQTRPVGAARIDKMFHEATGTDAFQAQTFQPVTSTGTFAHSAYQATWERTDRPVASGAVKRSWYWGPVPNTGGLQEDYAEGVGGKRLVQYFDKSRMEINNPAGDPKNPFFVTNGLLTVELISGKMQTGNATYVDRYPADIPLASDADDANAPTYMSFQGVANTPLGEHPAGSRLAQSVTATIARNGTVGDDPTKATYPKVNIIYFDQTTKHNIPLAIWEFLNEVGPVYDSATGKANNARLSDPWFYATGLPISEAYWAKVKIAGEMQDVLIQAFERRIVTYVPNGVPGFKVQMGNIGQHYYDWRYKDAGKPAPVSTAVPVATRPAGPTATAPAEASPTLSPEQDCSGIPAGQNTTVRVVLPGSPGPVAGNCGPGGTVFIFDATGFQPHETVALYFSAPDQAVYGVEQRFPADAAGALSIQFTSFPGFPAGIWALSMEGIDTHHKGIGYFKITAPAPTPTRTPAGTPSGPPPPCDTSSSRNGEAVPNNGRPGDVLQITARGFTPGETVSFWITWPDGYVTGTEHGIEGLVNPDGTIGPLEWEILDEDADYPGVWGLSFQGDDSGNKAVIFFCVNP
ncbi:MAG TPA: hypothetical protein VJ183_08140 [Chloroflexia bacterium]|nr:hypothetical protein [Chloroflexia bacterium]